MSARERARTGESAHEGGGGKIDSREARPHSSRKRSKSLAQSLTQTDTSADAAAEEQGEDGEEVEPHPLGNYLGEHWMKNSTSQESTPLRSTTST